MSDRRNAEGYEEIAMILIENPDGELLFLRRTVNPEYARASAGKWVPPGGHVEREGKDRIVTNTEESSMEAVLRAGIRETLEETGLDISRCTIDHILTFTDHDQGRKFLTHVLHVKLPPEITIDIKLSNEHDMLFWIHKDLMTRQVLSQPLSELRRDPTRPLSRNDYTRVTWNIVEGMAALEVTGAKIKGRPTKIV